MWQHQDVLTILDPASGVESVRARVPTLFLFVVVLRLFFQGDQPLFHLRHLVLRPDLVGDLVDALLNVAEPRRHGLHHLLGSGALLHVREVELKLARKHDPKMERTIGVVTKLDLMDQGTTASKLLQGKYVSFKLGVVGVRNRSQAEL